MVSTTRYREGYKYSPALLIRVSILGCLEETTSYAFAIESSSSTSIWIASTVLFDSISAVDDFTASSALLMSRPARNM
jgi:hypothetical protein